MEIAIASRQTERSSKSSVGVEMFTVHPLPCICTRCHHKWVMSFAKRVIALSIFTAPCQFRHSLTQYIRGPQVLKTQGGRLLAQTLAASPKKSASSLSTSETFASVGTQPATTPKGKGKAPSKRRLPMPQKFLDLITKFGEFDRTVCHARKMSQRTFVALQHTVQARTHKDFTLYDLGQICAVFPTVYSLERLIIEKSPQLGTVCVLRHHLIVFL